MLSVIAEGQGLEGGGGDSFTLLGGEGEKGALPVRQNSVHWEGVDLSLAQAPVVLGVGETAFDGESLGEGEPGGSAHGMGAAAGGGGGGGGGGAVKKSGGMFGMGMGGMNMNIGSIGSGMGMGMGSLGSMGGMFQRVTGGADPTKGDQGYADKGYTGLILEVGRQPMMRRILTPSPSPSHTLSPSHTS